MGESTIMGMSEITEYGDFIWALAVWREARGEALIGKVGVACVILARSVDALDRWPKDVAKVALQRAQFSCFLPGDPNSVLFPLPGGPEWGAWLEARRAVEEAKAGNDPTGGANHYHSIPDGRPFPKWADEKKETRQLGGFRFYKL